MFISRKQYENDLRKAEARGRRKEKEQNAIKEHMDFMEKSLYGCIDRLNIQVERNLKEIQNLYRFVSADVQCECECGEKESEKTPM